MKNRVISQDCKGKLIMAANVLGPLDFLPARTLAALQKSDVVIFEEDRAARQALKAAGIHRAYLKYSEHEEHETLEEVADSLQAGLVVCYLSDQGTPTVCDPGRGLLKVAYRLGASVEVIPGASSVTAALAACPFLDNQFYFRGFLPRAPQERERELQELMQFACPVVILDTPYRLKALLSDCARLFPSRNGLLAIDISGSNEGFHLGTFSHLQKLAEGFAKKLNFVLVIDGCSSA